MIEMTTSRQALYSTVRIRNHAAAGDSVGTGFIIQQPFHGKTWAGVVTNKHVVANAERLVVEFLSQDPATGMPVPGKKVEVSVPADEWIGHPDAEVDVAVIPIAKTLGDLGQAVFCRSLRVDHMPEPGDGVFIDAVEEIKFIGYPSGFQDPLHFTPVVRRGITASPLEMDFGGKPSFLIDGSVFGGSSGSPVFLLDHGFYRTDPTTVAVGNRFVLVGIIAMTWTQNERLPVEVAHAPHVKLAKELHLGLAYNWHAIKETISAMQAVLV